MYEMQWLSRPVTCPFKYSSRYLGPYLIYYKDTSWYLPYRKSQICESFFFSFSQILSAGMFQDNGFEISLKMPVADSSSPPK